MIKVKEKVKDVAQARTLNFKENEVKAIGCLKNNLGCNKTNHFSVNSEKGTVRCMFEGKDGCTSPFPRKEKAKKVKQKATVKKSSDKLGEGSILAGDEDLGPKVKKSKGKKRKAKLVQMEFEVEPHKPDKLKRKEEVKEKVKHSDKALKVVGKAKAKGFL